MGYEPITCCSGCGDAFDVYRSPGDRTCDACKESSDGILMAEVPVHREGAGSIPRPSLQLVHVELKDANEFIKTHHRHHGRIQGHRFSLGAKLKEKLVGVIVVGRPVGGQHQDDWTEVTRCCTDGTKNVCSFLYAAAARASRLLGFSRIQTYILKDESGVSLQASNWEFERMSHPVGWHHDGSREARHVPLHLFERKQLWFRDLS